jgi:hypothetical protein
LSRQGVRQYFELGLKHSANESPVVGHNAELSESEIPNFWLPTTTQNLSFSPHRRADAVVNVLPTKYNIATARLDA